MRQIITRLKTPGRLSKAREDKLPRANALLAPYGITIEGFWPGQPRLSHRPIELLEAIGTATIGSLDPAVATLERRIALHWGIIKYVADLETDPPILRISSDGQRYKEVARGAFSGDLGLAWSVLAAQEHITPGCTVMDIDHAGETFVEPGPFIRGLRGNKATRRRPDFVSAVDPTTMEFDLLEAKGWKSPPSPDTIAGGALQLMGVVPAQGWAVRNRYLCTIGGSQDLSANVLRVRELPGGFDPTGETDPDQIRPIREVDEPTTPGRKDGRTPDRRLSDGLYWLARGTSSEVADPPAASGVASEWTSDGAVFEGLATVTIISGYEVAIREGVAQRVLEVAAEGTQTVERARLVREQLVSEMSSRASDDAGSLARKTKRGAVFESGDRVTALGDYGTILEVEVLGP
jgi:hypothetical protein